MSHTVDARHVRVELVGPTVLTAHGAALAGLHHEPIKHPRPAEFYGTELSFDQAVRDPVLGEVIHQVRQYLEGQRRIFDIPLVYEGTPTQRAVWQELLTIPYGDVTSYGALAQALGKPGMAQAVGGAVGRNPISIIIPCHRVLGADGSLTGYAGGLHRKQRLLEIEGRMLAVE